MNSKILEATYKMYDPIASLSAEEIQKIVFLSANSSKMLFFATNGLNKLMILETIRMNVNYTDIPNLAKKVENLHRIADQVVAYTKEANAKGLW